MWYFMTKNFAGKWCGKLAPDNPTENLYYKRELKFPPVWIEGSVDNVLTHFDWDAAEELYGLTDEERVERAKEQLNLWVREYRQSRKLTDEMLAEVLTDMLAQMLEAEDVVL